MLDFDEHCPDSNIEFTFVEPNPTRLRGLLSERDLQRCTLEVGPVQGCRSDVFDMLEENDCVFIDSSHVAKTGSDVVYLVFDVLPRLAAGVLVHVHDILWPFEYPRAWIEAGRAYNEAYMIRAFLQYNAAFEVLYFNSFMAKAHAPLLRATMPDVLRLPSSPETEGNSSLWLRRAK